MTAPAAFALFDTAIGRCAIAWRGETIIAFRLPEPDEARLTLAIRRAAPDAAAADPSPAAQRAIRGVQALADGQPIDLADIAVDFGAASPFERAVWDHIRSVPPGATTTYGAIAEALGAPGAARAVGVALGRNPVPVIVPCHRVLASGGRAGGFSAPGGVTTKFRLLQIERAQAPDAAPGLFETLPLAVAPGRPKV